MIASLGQTLALVTHAHARLNGHQAKLDISANPWFTGVKSLEFGRGPSQNGIFQTSPEAWFRFIDGQFTSASLWFEVSNDVDRYAFAGAETWSPVTHAESSSVIWHSEFLAGSMNRLYRGGYQVQDGQESLLATFEEAEDALRSSIDWFCSFQRTHRAAEGHFATMAQDALRCLNLTTPLDFKPIQEVSAAFPPGLYAESAHRLAGAVHALWPFGGQGWWNDWSSRDSEIQKLFSAGNLELLRAMGLAMIAASSPQAFIGEPPKAIFKWPFRLIRR